MRRGWQPEFHRPIFQLARLTDEHRRFPVADDIHLTDGHAPFKEFGDDVNLFDKQRRRIGRLFVDDNGQVQGSLALAQLAHVAAVGQILIADAGHVDPVG